MKEVLRMGDWEDENVPLTLRRQLRRYESYISTWMSGFGFIEDDNHFLRPSSFDVYWHSGTWSFVLHGGNNGLRILLTDIKSKKLTYLAYLWADIFGLIQTYASRTGFYVTDFDMVLQETKVTFRGHYLDASGYVQEYYSTFSFTNRSQRIRVQSFALLDGVGVCPFNLSDRLYSLK